jgi:PAS domain S-box-containing protein
MQSGQVENIEEKYILNGQEIPVQTVKTPVKDEHGNVTGVLGIFWDVTERKKAERELRETNQYLENLFNCANAPIIVWDPQFKITRFNHAFEALTGRSAHDVIGKSIKILFPSDKVESSMEFIREAIEGKRWETVEINILHLDGAVRTVLWNSATLFDLDGKTPIATIAQGQDITERKEAEDKIRVFSDAIASAFDCFILTDTKGNITYANESAFRVFGYTPEEFLKLNVTKLDVDPTVAKKVVQELAAKGKWSGEVTNIKKNKEIFSSLLSTFTIKDDKGNQRGAMGIIRDITERKKAEQAFEKLNKDLELGVLNLSRSNKELQDFAYVVSHDLKAPLRGIKTLAQWITTDYADKLDQNGKEQMNLLVSRVDRMNNLIDGILQYSRVGRVQEKKARVNLNELVAEVIDMVAPPENISITIENDLPVIEFERTRIAQVFQNLLSNAIKYMDKPEGQVRIGCAEEDGFWKFTVADNGPGIEEKYFEKIFQMFQTLAPRDDVESTGVGLTVVKKIVELYGGKIWVESKVGEGSTFLFTLPKQETEVKDAQLQASIVG